MDAAEEEISEKETDENGSESANLERLANNRQPA